MSDCPPDPLLARGRTAGVPVGWPPTTKWPPRIPDPQHVDGPPGHTDLEHETWERARYDAGNVNTKAPEGNEVSICNTHQECYWPQIDAHQFRG